MLMGWWSVGSVDTRQQKPRQSSNYYFQGPMQQLKCTSAQLQIIGCHQFGDGFC